MPAPRPTLGDQGRGGRRPLTRPERSRSRFPGIDPARPRANDREGEMMGSRPIRVKRARRLAIEADVKTFAVEALAST